MPLYRIKNEQAAAFSARSSILIDKLDKCQGNFTGYQLRAKQPVYVPKWNPLDTNVKGYIDLAPTDEVLLSASIGAIKGLVDEGIISVDSTVSPAAIVAPVISSTGDDGTTFTITGTTLVSVDPDVEYVYLDDGAGATQTLTGSTVTAASTTIDILLADITIGTPGSGWTVQVKVNSKLSNLYTIP